MKTISGILYEEGDSIEIINRIAEKSKTVPKGCSVELIKYQSDDKVLCAEIKGFKGENENFLIKVAVQAESAGSDIDKLIKQRLDEVLCALSYGENKA